MGKFKIKFENEKDKEKLHGYIAYRLDIVSEKKKSLTVKAKEKFIVSDEVDKAINEYFADHGVSQPDFIDYDVEK